MAFNLDDASIGGQLKVGKGICPAIGESILKTNGSALIEGPAVIGSPTLFPVPYGTLNVGPLTNSDALVKPVIPGSLCTGINNPYSLAVSGPSAFLGVVDTALNLNVGGNITAQGEVMSRCGGHILSAKKNFDIPHPTRDGYRLRHTCPEGPSNDVYFRGRVTNKKEIVLPSYWKKLVDWTTITVNLTPVGSHQHVIVKMMDEEKIYLQSNGGMPIDCFFHVFATRADGERLIPEYEGKSPADYPGDNSQYSISGYHYDVK